MQSSFEVQSNTFEHRAKESELLELSLNLTGVLGAFMEMVWRFECRIYYIGFLGTELSLACQNEFGPQ